MNDHCEMESCAYHYTHRYPSCRVDIRVPEANEEGGGTQFRRKDDNPIVPIIPTLSIMDIQKKIKNYDKGRSTTPPWQNSTQGQRISLRA
jgi:hypothetical protein